MEYLIIVNDAPYASERAYNALRLATALGSDGDTSVRLFFVGDGAWCGVRDHKVPDGMHDVEWMIKSFLAGGCAAVCGTCMEARGIAPEMLIEGTSKSTLAELTAWTRQANQVLVF
jgi:uncharacterized protein involved in oxidation of intracellular sulfur